MALCLARAGHKIILGSRRSTVQPPPWLTSASVEIMDWGNFENLKKNCAGIDIVVHAAGMNSQDCSADPTEALTFNGVATTQLAEAAAEAGVKQFIYLSTAHVYGEEQTNRDGSLSIFTEETCPTNKNIYATSHLAGENGLLEIARTSLMKGLVLRLSNTFGAPSHKDVNCWMLLVNDLCRQAIEKKQLTLKTSGEHFRDFIPLEEVCSIIKGIVEDFPMSIGGNILNVGSGSPRTVLSMAKLIQTRSEKVLGFKPEIEVGHEGIGGQNVPIAYCSIYKPLLSKGISGDNFEKEIDGLLRFCRSAFSGA